MSFTRLRALLTAAAVALSAPAAAAQASRQSAPPLECGALRQRCCPGAVCGDPGLACSVERCRPCGGVLEPACTAVGAFPCDEGFTPIEGACFTDSAGVGRGSINTGRNNMPMVDVEIPAEPVADPPAEPPVAVEDPVDPDELEALGPAPVAPAAVEPAPVPDVGPTIDVLQLIADAEEDCGDIGEACCVLELDEETVGACLTGACPSDGAAVCADVMCGMPDGAEVQGVCVTSLPEDVEVPVDAGVPLPAPAAVPVSATVMV